MCALLNISCYLPRFQIESNRKRNAIESALRAHDRVAKAEKQRLQQLNTNSLFRGMNVSGGYNSFNLLTNLSFGSGCRCCYDPNGDGGEYELLASMKRERQMSAIAAVGVGGAVEDEETGSDNNAGSDNDSDSDDEFNYLLECDIPATDNYGDADGDRTHGDYDDLQAQRRADLQNMAYHNEVAQYHGYGVHRQMHPGRIFAAAGYGSENNDRDKICPPGSVVHLYDAHSSLSVSLDICLDNMAMRYGGTKFVRGLGITSILYADGGDNDWKRADLPMLLAIKSGRIVAWSSGLRDFYRDRSQTEVEDALVEQWLDRAGVLHTHPPPLDALCKIRPEEDMLLANMRYLNGSGRGGMPRQNNSEEVVDVEDERFDCGLVGCNKSFYHEHVGVKNDAQAGVLVKESQVVTSSNDIVGYEIYHPFKNN